MLLMCCRAALKDLDGRRTVLARALPDGAARVLLAASHGPPAGRCTGCCRCCRSWGWWG